MSHDIKNDKRFDRAGTKQTYTQEVASALNWWRRCMIGLMHQVDFKSGYFITAASGYQQMSEARKIQLAKMLEAKQRAREALDLLIEEIEEFSKLPITLADEAQGRIPKRKKQDSIADELIG